MAAEYYARPISAEWLDEPPPQYDTYLQIVELLTKFEWSVEDVMPMDVIMTDELLETTFAHPDEGGRINPRFRWYIIETALSHLAGLYEVYNLLPDNPLTGLRTTRRGFEICGPASIMQKLTLIGEDIPLAGSGTLALEIRLHRPDPIADPHGKIQDHTILTLDPGGEYLHFIDVTGGILAGPTVDFSQPYAAKELIRHRLYSKASFDEQLALDYNLYPFPEDSDDPIWKDLYLFTPGSSPDDLVTMTELINSPGSLAVASMCKGGVWNQTPFWGPYLWEHYVRQSQQYCDDLASRMPPVNGEYCPPTFFAPITMADPDSGHPVVGLGKFVNPRFLGMR